MHWARIPSYSRVKTKFKNWFFSTKLVAGKLRGCLMMVIFSVTLGEICAYRLLRQNVTAGDFPPYMTDLFIVLLAVLEAIVAPFIGWVGYNRRRIMMAVACLITGVISLLWLALPKVHVVEGGEFCNGINTSHHISHSSNIPLRLSIIILTFTSFGVTRLIVFSHGIAYIDEYAPSKMALHFGILTTSRLLSFIVGYNMLSVYVETYPTSQTLAFVIDLLISFVRLIMNIPRKTINTGDTPAILKDHFGFFSSVGRILSNALVTSQMAAMALTASAIWGFAYHQEAFIMAKYNINLDINIAKNSAELLRLIVVVFVTALILLITIAIFYVLINPRDTFFQTSFRIAFLRAGTRINTYLNLLTRLKRFLGVVFGPPMMQKIKNKELLSITIKAYALIILAYIASGMLPCTTGDIAGLQEKNYTQPQCSQLCGCDINWPELLPVCVADQMRTYLSPCHTGCSGVETIGGIQMYTNCTCAPLTSRATRGSCSDYSCRGIFELHELLYIVMLSGSALAFQAHGMVMLRSVDNRDKSVLVGMISSAIALFAFCCGHFLFLGVSAGTCNWYENGRCILQNKTFPYVMGVVCAAFILFSLLITITTVVFMNMAEKRMKGEPPVELKAAKDSGI